MCYIFHQVNKYDHSLRRIIIKYLQGDSKIDKTGIDLITVEILKQLRDKN